MKKEDTAMQDIFERVQSLINELESGRIKQAAKDDRNMSDIEKELKRYEIVDQVRVEPSEFTKAMDEILSQAVPASPSNKDEETDDGAETEDVEAASDATTDVSVADGETDYDVEESIITGEDVDKALKQSARQFRKLSDVELISVLRKSARMLCQAILQGQVKNARDEEDDEEEENSKSENDDQTISQVVQKASDDADLVAGFIHGQRAAAGDFQAIVQALANILGVQPDEVETALKEIASELLAAGTQITGNPISAAAMLIQALERAQLVAPGVLQPQTVVDALLALGIPEDEIATAIDELIDEIAETVDSVEKETVPSVLRERDKTEEGEEEDSERASEEEEATDDVRLVQELGNVLEDMGMTPEELIEEATTEEKKEAAMKVASAIKILKRSGRYRRTIASKAADRRLRQAVRDYLIELISY